MRSLDGRSGPLYRRVTEDIAEQIASGLLKPGDKLPSERELCGIYDVSQITVRRALRELRHAGQLISRHGLGWFVSEELKDGRPVHDVCIIVPEPGWLLGTVLTRVLKGLEAASLSTRLTFCEADASPESLEAARVGEARAALLAVEDDVVAGRYATFLRDKGVPMVLMLRELEGAQEPAVVLDEQECMALVTRYVLDLGHRRIAYVGGDPSALSERGRYWGFANALWGRGLELPLDWVWAGPLSRDGGPRFRAVFEGPQPPTAVVCSDDLRALLVMSLLTDMGKRCPGDVAIVSMGDRGFAPLLPAPLTTFRFDLARLADTAVAMVQDVLAGREPETVRVTGQLVPRQSCGSAVPAPD